MLFRGDILHSEDEAKMAQWEMKLYEFSNLNYNNSLIEIFVLGNEIVEVEMNKDAQKTLPFFAMGKIYLAV